ncbi:MAG: phosphoglucosamine mutase [Bacteroidota bacterium]
MTLIKSISGIRGTIGGKPGDNLTPIDAVKFAGAFGHWLKKKGKGQGKVVVGRDARISGKMIMELINNTLNALGLDVVCLDYATTPTVEMAVPEEKALGGIVLTASHNPKQWNALKLLNNKGEFISGSDGVEVLELVENGDFSFAPVDELGTTVYNDTYNTFHINKILQLDLIDTKAIKKANFTVAIDCVNSVGGIIIPDLLKKLGVAKVVELYTEPTGEFPHNPEPLPAHLIEISEMVKKEKADLGFVVDPDVDRLAIINEDGGMFGEEYTLVAVADYILQHKQGNTVSNLSSSRALRDVTQTQGGQYTPAAVGEVHVVEMMRKTNAIIGGEGNGGIIYPALHYGRDALVGIALFLSYLAKSGKRASALRAGYPSYFMSKNKIELTPSIDVDGLLEKIKNKYRNEQVTDIDGVKIDFTHEWVHLRKSNTEPIIRIYTEGKSQDKADALAERIMEEINELQK